MIAMAATANNIRVVIDTIIVTWAELWHGGPCPSCPSMEDITFQIEGLLMDQSQKSLRQSKVPDFFAAE